MTQVIAVDTKIANDLLSLLRELKEQVVRLNEKLELEPIYGSNEWWNWSDKKAKEDIKAGRYITLHSAKEAQEYLDSLKSTS